MQDADKGIQGDGTRARIFVQLRHDLDLVAEHADRVVLIDRGVAAEGTPEDVYEDPRFIETFGRVGFGA